MSVTNAFLHDISDDPEDDAPRLIYADWLEDHGDSAHDSVRAAFIRASVKLARLPDDHPERPVLEDEVDDLLARHEERWAADVSRIALEWEWRRGFVERVTVSADAFREQGEELLACGPIREVRLLGGGEELAAVAGCRHLERVETLDLNEQLSDSVFRLASLSDQPLSALLRSPHFTRLRSLNLAGHRIEGPAIRTLVEVGLLARLQRLQLNWNRSLGDRATRMLIEARPARLEELGLQHTNLSPHGIRSLFEANWPRLRRLDVNAALTPRPQDPVGGFRHLLGSKLLPHLENLTLNFLKLSEGLALTLLRDLAEQTTLHGLTELQGSRIGPQSMAVLARLSRLPELRTLQVSESRIDPEAVGLLAAANLRGLRSLDLRENPLEDTGAEILAGAEFIPRLTHLNLWGVQIGGPGLAALLNVKGTSLRQLNLGQNWVGSTGAELIAGSEAARGLTRLYLNESNLRAEGARALAESPHLSRLRVLSLAHNRLGDEGVCALAASPHLFRLRELYLDGNDLSNSAAEALLESPYLNRVRKLGLRGAYFSYTEHERLRARFGEGVVF